MVDATVATQPTRSVDRDRWPRPFRWAVYLAIALVVVLVAALITGVVVVRQSWPQTTGTLHIDGLDGTVQVVRDAHGIPQIYAGTMHDLMLAQGYVSAQERFFEMDVRRHATAGRLSEMFGKSGLETDLLTRTMGWRHVAEQELRLLSPSTRDALDAYADGVNDYLAGRSLSQISLEYSILGLTGFAYHPARWTAVDSISWLEAMAWDLRGNLDDEISRALTAAAVGPGRAAQLFPPYDYSAHAPIVGGPGRAAPPRPTDPTTSAKPDDVGSNAWVVSGRLTTTGSPILANDPHLGVSIPGTWMQIGLHCRTVSETCPLDVAGFSFSGLPGVVIGHNAHIAWGFTNLDPDVSDLYVERVRGNRWQYDGRSRPMRVRTEHIKVRDDADLTFRVRETSHGPLLSDISHLADRDGEVRLTQDGLLQSIAETGRAVSATLPRARGWKTAVALDWTALQPHPTADALLALDEAHSWGSFHKALAGFAVPGQNVVYADTAGHIGYQATGRVPIRRDGRAGDVPVAGWDPRNDWTGRYIPYARMPRELDPSSGMIVTANQAVVAPSRYPYHLTDDWDRGYRSTRIAQRLREATAGGRKISVATMSSIQMDDINPMAQVLLPYLERIQLPHGYYSAGQRLLEDWNGGQDPQSAAAAYFNVVWRELLHRTFADELPRDLQPDGSSRWFDVVTDLLRRPDDKWWDDTTTHGVRESRDDILRASLMAARDDLTRLESPDPQAWSWGQIHQLDLRSSTLGSSGVGIVERLFNRGGWEVGGGSSLVDATSWDARDGYDVTVAPSMRMVVPMNDLDQARWINLTGESGHAFDPHYTDQTDLWAKGETLPWAFSERAVRAAGTQTLTLEPDKS
ncbi:MAG: penicillin acylase family protein [Nocardioidaceae bacterium]|nr:penicillin acylase family protein [Nocardioidaceae bacterium]MCL2613710.1 penicillin acylase family protein [Nocardioidaceae bacterium]